MEFNNLPNLTTERLCVRMLDPDKAGMMSTFRVKNRQYLEPWEPKRSPEFFTEPFWQVQLRAGLRDYSNGNSCCLTIMDKAESEILGVCNFTNIIRGTFQSCHLGYALAECQQHNGFMAEALDSSINYMFTTQRLHRIMANYLPNNDRSAALLKRLGFKIEGYAKRFLLINGQWKDHVLTSLINPSGV